MNARISQAIHPAVNNKQATRRLRQVQHYLDFCQAAGLNPLITNPLDSTQQLSLLRYAGYERSEFHNKGSTIKAKLEAVDQWHTENDLSAPMAHNEKLLKLLQQWKRADPPAQPRIPVTAALVELYGLEQPMETEDQRAVTCSMAVGLEFCLRSKEYLMPDTNQYDPQGVHWKDAFFRDDTGNLSGAEVAGASKLTLSIVSSKNSLARCTRTVHQTSSSVSAVRLLKQRYLDILTRTGKPPEPETPIFQLSTGLVISRKTICNLIQDTLESLGVPRRFAGSHSLRRGGSCMYRAAGMADEDIARFGRWTSNAYKLYIHIESSALSEWGERAVHIQPRFELN